MRNLVWVALLAAGVSSPLAMAKTKVGICYAASGCRGLEYNAWVTLGECARVMASNGYEVGSWLSKSSGACTNVSLTGEQVTSNPKHVNPHK